MADTGEPRRQLRDAGVVAEWPGQFLDTEGRQVVAIAGGQYKHDAILAALRSGLLNGLVADERTARAIVDLAF